MSKTLVKADYKQTDLGMIPKSWDVKSIGDLIRFQGGSQPPRDTFVFQEKSDHIRLLQIRDYKNDKYKTFIPKRLARRFCSKDDIMIGRYGPPIFQILRGLEGAYNVALIKAIPGDEILKDYAWHVLKQESLFAFVEKLSQRSSGQTGVDLVELNKYLIAFPKDRREQKIIVQALANFDSLITKLSKLIQKKRHIKQGAMQELLTGKRRLPGFGGEWKETSLGDVSTIKTGSKNNQDKKLDGKYPFFVRSATVERIDSYSYNCEAILVPGEGGVGSIFHYIYGKFEVHQRVYCINNFINTVSGKYIYFFISQSFGKHALENTVKATVDSLRLPTFQEFKILLPPTKNEQTAIAHILSEMDAEIETLEKQKAKYIDLKQGMMQQLLTGKIRLI